MLRIAHYLKYGSKIAKLKVNIILLLLGVQGHLIVWHISMASYIYMKNLNEIIKLFSVYSMEK